MIHLGPIPIDQLEIGHDVVFETIVPELEVAGDQETEKGSEEIFAYIDVVASVHFFLMFLLLFLLFLFGFLLLGFFGP